MKYLVNTDFSSYIYDAEDMYDLITCKLPWHDGYDPIVIVRLPDDINISSDDD